MTFLKEYEKCLKLSLSPICSADEVGNIAKLLMQIRHRIFCYEKLDIHNHHFFITKDVIFAENTFGKYDYLSLPASHLLRVINHVLNNLRSGIVRENILMPIYKANEFNSYSINWLSKRPGRTVREKLSGTKSIMAVRRRMSIDTLENRLVKAVINRMACLLQKKSDVLAPLGGMPSEEKELLQVCKLFLRSDTAKEIGIWMNLPPNNTLLSDRFYHGIWTTWNDLKRINNQLQEDQKNLPKLLCSLSVLRLIQLASYSFKFPQVPFFYDWMEHSGKYWSLMNHIVGIGPRGMVVIDWSKNNTIQIFYRNKSKEIIFDYTLMEIKDNIAKSIEVKRITALSLRLELEKLLQKVCENDYTKNYCSKNNNKISPYIYEGVYAVIDLFSIRPQVVIDEHALLLPELLISQKIRLETSGDYPKQNIVFNVGKAEVLLCASNSELCTVISAVEDHSAEKIIDLQRHLAIIKKSIKAECLTFLYPDSYNEFQLQPVKQMAKIYYYQARAIPKSLDVVFCYMKESNMNHFSAGDAFILIDRVAAVVSMTIVVSVYNDELANKLPESHGLIWEHHPSTLFDYEMMLCPEGFTDEEKEVISFIGSDIVFSKDVQLDFLTVKDKPVSLQTLREKLLSQPYDISDQLQTFISDNKKILKGRKIHLIKLAGEISLIKDLPSQVVVDTVSGKAGEGVFYYDKLVAKMDEIPFWRDYLPNIAIKRMIGFFDLVKDSTFEYGSIKEKEISIPNTSFTLPMGQKEYHFQLFMENASKKAIFEAVIRHTAFPLKTNTACELKMKYTYNADNPYSLQFIPLDRKQAGFSVAKVSWEPLLKYPVNNLPYQEFPSGESWELLERFPDRRNPDMTMNLLEQLHLEIRQLFEKPERIIVEKMRDSEYSNVCYLQALFEDGTQRVLSIKKEVFRNACNLANEPELYYELQKKNNTTYRTFHIVQRIKNTKRFTIDLGGLPWNSRGRITKDVCINGSNISVNFDVDNFIFPDNIPKKLQLVSFYVKEDFKKTFAFAQQILPADIGLYQILNIYVDYDKAFLDKFKNELKFKETKLLFLMRTIYRNGRSLYNQQRPTKFKNALLQDISELVNIYKKLSLNYLYNDSKRFLLKILCLANRDAGDDFYICIYKELKYLLQNQNFVPPFYSYALGNYETPAEQWLFKYLLELHNNNFINNFISILTRAVWYSELFLMNAPSEVLIKLFEESIKEILKDLRIKKIRSEFLEYVLAVFRLRKKNNAQINEKLSLNNPLLAHLYSDMEKMIIKKQVPEFNTRINLTLKKSKEYSGMDVPDLIYALMVCISGTNSENTILISSIDEEDI